MRIGNKFLFQWRFLNTSGAEVIGVVSAVSFLDAMTKLQNRFSGEFLHSITIEKLFFDDDVAEIIFDE